jgi:hypothetical protein
VLDVVNAWAKAWSAKNVDAYLAFYGKDFKTPGGESRASWEKGPPPAHRRAEVDHRHGGIAQGQHG